jgi:hypothetical protein
MAPLRTSPDSRRMTPPRMGNNSSSCQVGFPRRIHPREGVGFEPTTKREGVVRGSSTVAVGGRTYAGWNLRFPLIDLRGEVKT